MAPPPVLFQSWTGWYVGLNAGGAWGNNNGVDNTINSTFCNIAIPGCGPNQASNALAAAVPGTFDTGKNSGFIGGGQFGYNLQAGQFVWGLETDFQGADIHGDSSLTNSVGVTGFPGTTATVTGEASQKIDFFGTLRGRLGWTPTAPWLIYATGGLAYGHTKTDVSFTSHFAPCFCGPDPSSSVSQDEWRAGWTVGGGVEWMFAPQWSLRGEYLYYDLGSVSVDNSLNQLNGAGARFVGVGITSDVHYKGNIARAAINYHF
jgi:outer membrane immunogenic protein